MATILIVEDNELNRDMLSRRLQRRGYDTIIAIDGETGIAEARSKSPDVILMDMSLPGIDGWEATRLLKADAATQRIPIIALTAHAMAGDRDKSMEVGCDDYDTKPVDIERLLSKIERWLKTVPDAAPAVAPDIAQVVVDEPLAEAPQFSEPTATIVIVEDNQMNRDMLSRRLARRGFAVTTAVDGEQGIAAIKASLPDLVLMDMSLPGIDGWEATKLLRQSAETRHIPIIALTAHAMSSDREKAIEAGCNDYDTKPVEIARLLGKIEALLAHKEQ